jgi:acetyl esterase/lipase
VTDSDMSRLSYQENAEGYVLTAGLMVWFWDHYADPADRNHPKASPLHGDLSNLPPAVIVTAEFDPLRDEGKAYADALVHAGVPVHYICHEGMIHHFYCMAGAISYAQPAIARAGAAIGEALS